MTDIWTNETEEDIKIKKVIPHLEALGYSKNHMQFENTDIEVFYGKKKTRIRSDIIVNIVHKNKITNIMVVEVKSPKHKLGKLEKEQAISYARLHTPPIKFAVITNGSEWKTFHAGTKERIKGGVPSFTDSLSLKYDLSERQIQESKKFVVEGYKTAKEIIHALGKCHDIMRSNDGFTPLDAFDEIAKLIYTKTQAEKRQENKFTKYYFQKECAVNGKIDYQKVKIQMERIFEDAINDYQYNEKIFDENSKIEICGESILEIVKTLDNRGFIETDYEMMGFAFESFLSAVFRGEKLGQYFTPREIVDFAIDMIDVKFGERIVDPCFGSGGFLVAAFKNIRERILNANFEEEKERFEVKKLCQEYIFGADINKRLSIACKINMYIHGDGRTGIYHQDGLLDVDEIIENKFNKIFTNPPFGSKITKREILEKFSLAGSHRKMQRSEVLFLERCVKLLKPQGQMAIVLPDIVLNGANNKNTRKFIFDKCQILAIVSLPSQTFIRSGASVKTSLLFLEKKLPMKIYTDKIFMAIPEKVGFDSAGRPDESELGKVVDAFHEFQKGNEFKENEIVFTVSIENIKDRIDPKIYRIEKKIDTEFELVRLGNLVKDLTDKRRFKIQNDEKYCEPTISSKTHKISVARKKLGKELKVKTRIKIQEGDLVFSKLHTQNGLFAISDKEFAATNSFLPVQINETKIHKDYLCEILTKAVKFLILEGDSVGRETYKARQILDLKIPLPTLEYQKILLEKINKQIENIGATEILIKNLLEIDEDLFEDFEKVELGEIVKIKKEKIEPQKNKDVKFNYIGLEHIEKNSGKIIKNEIVNGKDLASTKSVFKKGEMLYGKLRPNLNKLYLANFDGICSTDILVFIINIEKINPIFLKYILLRKNFVKEISKKMSGANLPRIKVNELISAKIPLPSLKTQKEIVKKLDEQFARIEILREIKKDAVKKRKEIIKEIF